MGPGLGVGATAFRKTQSREEGRHVNKQLLPEQDKTGLTGDASACCGHSEEAADGWFCLEDQERLPGGRGDV